MSALQLRSSCSPLLLMFPRIGFASFPMAHKPRTRGRHSTPSARSAKCVANPAPPPIQFHRHRPRAPSAAFRPGAGALSLSLPAAELGGRAARKGPGRPFEWWKCVRLTLSISLPPFPPLPPSRVRPPSASVPRPVSASPTLLRGSVAPTSPTKRDRLRGCPASSSSPPRR